MSRRAFAARVAGLLLLLLGCGYAVRELVIRPLRCMRAASLGAAILENRRDGADYQAQRTGKRILADVEGCDCVAPPDSLLPTTIGAAADLAGDHRAAIAAYERALVIDRRPEIYLRLGLAQIDALEPGAVESLVRACAFDPRRLADIPYPELRRETKTRVRRQYGNDWIP